MTWSRWRRTPRAGSAGIHRRSSPSLPGPHPLRGAGSRGSATGRGPPSPGSGRLSPRAWCRSPSEIPPNSAPVAFITTRSWTPATTHARPPSYVTCVTSVTPPARVNECGAGAPSTGSRIHGWLRISIWARETEGRTLRNGGPTASRSQRWMRSVRQRRTRTSCSSAHRWSARPSLSPARCTASRSPDK